MIQIRIASGIVTEFLATGYTNKNGFRVIDGIPSGSHLISADIDDNGSLILNFLDPKDPGDVMDVNVKAITIEAIEND